MTLRPTITQVNHTSNTKGKTMFRRLTPPILALGIATSVIAGTAPALAASHPAAAAKEAERSQAGLMTSIKGLGYALLSGPAAKINSYATPALLVKAPNGSLYGLVGPVQNPPASFTFRVTAYTGYTGAARMELKRGDTGLIERTQWVYTAKGWKLTDFRYVGMIPTRQTLLTANYVFMHDLRQGSGTLNSYATAAFLRQAPGGQLINLYGFQNPFRTASANINWLRGGTAQVTQRFDFGAQNIQVRIVTWSATEDGWRISGVAGAGRG